MNGKNKMIVKAETVPYLTLFDLNKKWLDLKQDRQLLIERMRQLRANGYNLTMEINEIEEKISQQIEKLSKNEKT
jgi:hypothetical protein